MSTLDIILILISTNILTWFCTYMYLSENYLKDYRLWRRTIKKLKSQLKHQQTKEGVQTPSEKENKS